MKKILVLLVLAILFFVMVGCAKSETNLDDETIVVSETQIIIGQDPNIDFENELNNDENILKEGELLIINGSGEYDNDYFEYSFSVKNDSKYELKGIGATVLICDADDNVLGTDSRFYQFSLDAGKQGIIKGMIDKSDLVNAEYIKIDYFDYDIDGDYSVVELYADKENAEKTKIKVNESVEVTSESITVIEDTSYVSVKKESVEFNFDDALSNPAAYEGKYVKLEGRILAKESGGNVMMAFHIDTTPNRFSSKDKIVHVSYVDDYIDPTAYKLGDMVVVYGEFTGVGEYDTAYAQDEQMPKILADTVEVQ